MKTAVSMLSVACHLTKFTQFTKMIFLRGILPSIRKEDCLSRPDGAFVQCHLVTLSISCCIPYLCCSPFLLDNLPETTAMLFCLDGNWVVGQEGRGTNACDHGWPRPSRGRENGTGLRFQTLQLQMNMLACDVAGSRVEGNILQKDCPTPGSRGPQTYKKSRLQASKASEALCTSHNSL